MFYDPNLKPKSNYEWEVEKSRQSLLKNGGREGMSVNMYDPSVNLRESLGFGQDEGIYDDDGYGGGERFSEGATLRKSVQEHGLGVMNDPKYCNPHEDITLEYNSHEGMWHCIGPGIPHEIVVGVTKDKALGALEKWLAQAQEKHVAKKAERKSEALGGLDTMTTIGYLRATNKLNRKDYKKTMEKGWTGVGAVGGLVAGGIRGLVGGGLVGKLVGKISGFIDVAVYDAAMNVYKALKSAMGGKEPTEDQLHAACVAKGINLKGGKGPSSMNDYSESALYLQYLREASEKDEEEEDEEELDEEGHEHHGKKKDKKEEGAYGFVKAANDTIKAAGKAAVKDAPTKVKGAFSHVNAANTANHARRAKAVASGVSVDSVKDAAVKKGMSTGKKVAIGAAGAVGVGGAAYGAKKLYDKKNKSESESDYSEAFSSQGFNSKRTGSSEVADLHRKDIDFDRLVKNNAIRHDRKDDANNIQSLLGIVAATLTAYGAKKLYDWFKSNPDADKEEVHKKAKKIKQEESRKGKKESFSGYSEAELYLRAIREAAEKDDEEELDEEEEEHHGKKRDKKEEGAYGFTKAANETIKAAGKATMKAIKSSKPVTGSHSFVNAANSGLNAAKAKSIKDGVTVGRAAKEIASEPVKTGMSTTKKVALGAAGATAVGGAAYAGKKMYDKKKKQESYYENDCDNPDEEFTYSESLVIDGDLIGSLCDRDPFSDFRNFARNQAMAQLAESESKKHKDHEDEESEEYEEEEEDGIEKKKKLEEAGVGAAAKAAAGAVKKAVGSQVKKSAETGVGGAIKNVAKTGLNHAKIISHDIGSGIAKAATKHPRSVGAGAVGGATALGGVTGVAGRMSKRKED